MLVLLLQALVALDTCSLASEPVCATYCACICVTAAMSLAVGSQEYVCVHAVQHCWYRVFLLQLLFCAGHGVTLCVSVHDFQFGLVCSVRLSGYLLQLPKLDLWWSVLSLPLGEGILVAPGNCEAFVLPAAKTSTQYSHMRRRPMPCSSSMFVSSSAVVVTAVPCTAGQWH
jgi:hypothetical protein